MTKRQVLRSYEIGPSTLAREASLGVGEPARARPAVVGRTARTRRL